MAAIHAGQIENRVNSMNHALVIIGEMQGVLDFERGGDVAPKLESFGRTHLSAVAHWMTALQATR